MDGDSYPADPMIDLAKADDAVNLFKKGKKIRFEIPNPESRVNKERIGIFLQFAKSGRGFDALALSGKNTIAFERTSGYQIPPDSGSQIMFVLILSVVMRSVKLLKPDIEQYANTSFTDYVGVDVPVKT